MLGTILIVLGICTIITAIFLILREGGEEKDIHRDILIKYSEIKEYTEVMEQIVDNLDTLVETTIKSININTEHLAHREINSVPIENINSANKTDSNDIPSNDLLDTISLRNYSINDEVLELNSLGYSNQEIAKKLHKGVREVEIILKLSKYL